MTTTLEDLRLRIKGITAIPASEQFIGHLQMALMGILDDICAEIDAERLETIYGGRAKHARHDPRCDCYVGKSCDCGLKRPSAASEGEENG